MKCKYCGTNLIKNMNKCPGCGRVNRHFNKKPAIIIGAAFLLVVTAVMGVVFAVSDGNNKLDIKIIDEETGEYMLMNVPADITFDIGLNGSYEAGDFEIKDIYGNSTDIVVKELSEDSVRINAPTVGYTKGEVYTADLKNKGVFLNQEFKGAKKLIFVVERKNTAVVKYKTGVKELSGGNVAESDGILTIKGSYNNGDIIVCDTNQDKIDEIYKLRDAEKRDGITTASYSEPEADEVYEELDIFYYQDVDLRKADIDEAAVGRLLESSGVIEAFTDEAYAAEKVLTAAEFDGKKNFKVTLKDPDDENRQLEIKFGISDKVLLKCTVNSIFVDNTVTATSGIEFSVKGSVEKDTEKSIREAFDDYIVDKNASINENEYKETIIPVTIPVAGPVSVYVELGGAAEFAVSAEYKTGIDAEMNFNQGIIFDLDEFKVRKKYADITGDIEAYMMVKGRLDAYAGIYLEAGADVASLVKAGLRADGGPYISGKGCFVIKGIPENVKADGYYKIEVGLKYMANATVDLPLLKEKTYELGSAEKPLAQYSKYHKLKSVNLKSEYYIMDGSVSIGVLRADYYDKIENEDKGDALEKYTLYIDGRKTEVDNGEIRQNLQEGDHTFRLEWRYKGQKFEEEKNVRITRFDPWSNFKRVNVIGMTFSEINVIYGDLKYEYYYHGGNLFKCESTDMEFSFDTFLIMNYWDEAVCTGMHGSVEDFFGIKKTYRYNDFFDMLDVYGTYDGYKNYSGGDLYDQNYAFYVSQFSYNGTTYKMFINDIKDKYISPEATCVVLAK